MVVTEEWMRKWYNTFNSQYFDNMLPNIPLIASGDAKVQDGRCDADDAVKWYENGVAKYKFKSIKLRMSNYYDWREDDLKNTLLHEMVHVFEFHTHPAPFFENKNYDAHGDFFMAKANEINQDGWHIGRYTPAEAIQNRKVSSKVETLKNKRQEKGCYVLTFEFDPSLNKPYYCGIQKARSTRMNDWVLGMMNSKYYRNFKLYFTQDPIWVGRKFDDKHYYIAKTKQDMEFKIATQGLKEVPLPQAEETKPITVISFYDNWGDIHAGMYLSNTLKISIDELMQPVADNLGYIEYYVFEISDPYIIKRGRIRKYDKMKLTKNAEYYNVGNTFLDSLFRRNDNIRKIGQGTLHENYQKPLSKLIKEIVDNYIENDMGNIPIKGKTKEVPLDVEISIS